VPRRIAARLLTGPLAFLLGGVIDILAYATTVLGARVRLARRRSDGSVRGRSDGS
jgi:hypothetical protein